MLPAYCTCRWCERNGFTVKVVERQAGDEAGIKSSEVEVQVSVGEGEEREGGGGRGGQGRRLTAWCGSHP